MSVAPLPAASAPAALLPAALRVLFDVAVYRLRKLEMANMVAAVAVMLTLRLPWPEVAERTAFAALLNLLAYTTNDYCDVERDLAQGRESAKTRFLHAHRRAALWAQLGLAAVLALLALGTLPELLLAGSAGAGLCWAYSARLKLRPYVDVLAMALWGVAMPMVAFPLGSQLGWVLALQLGLFSACFETIQVLRDREQDALASLRTTGVVLGDRRTLLLARLLMVASAVYGALFVHRFIALAMLLAPLLPVPAPSASASGGPAPMETDAEGHVSVYWNRVRLVFGLCWLGLLGAVYLQGASAGWLLTLQR